MIVAHFLVEYGIWRKRRSEKEGKREEKEGYKVGKKRFLFSALENDGDSVILK